MRMIVMFDLPVRTKKQRGEAARFRNFLLNDGYFMLQYSVYVRICGGLDSVATHRARLSQNVPDNGSIRMMLVTERQYASIDLLLGNYTKQEELVKAETLTLF